MSKVPSDRKYTKSHEWVKVLGDGSLLIGITEHAQDLLGDMVYVEVPEVGRTLGAEEACAVVESVKAASDVYSPAAGEVIESNDALADSPETVNTDPYGAGWLMKLRPTDADATEQLLDAPAYSAYVESEQH